MKTKYQYVLLTFLVASTCRTAQAQDSWDTAPTTTSVSGQAIGDGDYYPGNTNTCSGVNISWSYSFYVNFAGCSDRPLTAIPWIFYVSLDLFEDGQTNSTPVYSGAFTYSYTYTGGDEISFSTLGETNITLSKPISVTLTHLVRIQGAAYWMPGLASYITPVEFGMQVLQRDLWPIVPTHLDNGVFKTTFGNLTPGLIQIIEASPNLTNWNPLVTNTISCTNLVLTDYSAISNPRTFYRIREVNR